MFGSNCQKVLADQFSICLLDHNRNLTYYGISSNGKNNYLFKELPTSFYRVVLFESNRGSHKKSHPRGWLFYSINCFYICPFLR